MNAPDWLLIRAISRTVTDSRWCGGLSRDELARQLGLRPWDHSYRQALMIAYKTGRIDFCGPEYVVPGARWTRSPYSQKAS